MKASEVTQEGYYWVSKPGVLDWSGLKLGPWTVVEVGEGFLGPLEFWFPGCDYPADAEELKGAEFIGPLRPPDIQTVAECGSDIGSAQAQ